MIGVPPEKLCACCRNVRDVKHEAPEFDKEWRADHTNQPTDFRMPTAQPR